MRGHTKPALRTMPASQVQISLPVQGVLRDVRHAFLGLCIDAGQKVLAAMMEADRIALCGPKGVPDAGRRAVPRQHHRQPGRAGRPAHRRTATAGTLDDRGRVVTAQLRVGCWPRPAGRRHDGRHRRGCVDSALRQHPGAGCRRHTDSVRPPRARCRAASCSSASSSWHSGSHGPWSDLDLPVVMIDGIHFRDRVILLALGIDAQGGKHVLGLREGSTEATRVVVSLLSGPGRARAGCPTHAAVGDRRRQGRCARPSSRPSARARSSSAARSTSAATCWSTCPKTCTPASSGP